MIKNPITCPNKKNHVKGEPTGYVAWFEWAEKKAKTHIQKRCPNCNLYIIWEKK